MGAAPALRKLEPLAGQRRGGIVHLSMASTDVASSVTPFYPSVRRGIRSSLRDAIDRDAERGRPLPPLTTREETSTARRERLGSASSMSRRHCRRPAAPVFAELRSRAGFHPAPHRGKPQPNRAANRGQSRAQPPWWRRDRLDSRSAGTLPRWILVDTTVSGRMRQAVVTTNTTVSGECVWRW